MNDPNAPMGGQPPMGEAPMGAQPEMGAVDDAVLDMHLTEDVKKALEQGTSVFGDAKYSTAMLKKFGNDLPSYKQFINEFRTAKRLNPGLDTNTFFKIVCKGDPLPFISHEAKLSPIFVWTA